VNSQSDHKNADNVEFSEMYNCASYASTAMFKSNRCYDFVDRGYLFEFSGFHGYAIEDNVSSHWKIGS
jgi:hypothetical protein